MLALLAIAAADIPVHCLISDFAGEWVLHLAEPVQPGTSSPDVPDFQGRGIEEDYCYSGHPNRNAWNVQLNLAARLAKDGVPMKQLHANLTENIAVRQDALQSEHLSAALNGEAATWTTAYDEGFEIRRGPQYRFFALARYACMGSTNCGEDGVGELPDGATVGYRSECGQTLVGWYHTPEGKGCFYGEKLDPAAAAAVHSYVLLEQSGTARPGRRPRLPVYTAYHRQDFGGNLPSYSSVLDMHKDKSTHAGFRTLRRSGSLRRIRAQAQALKVRDECAGDAVAQADEIAALEREHPVFDWREQFHGKWNVAVQDQGGCGSCYAMAMTYALQSRANIMRLRELGERGLPAEPPVKLSAHSVMSCSYYNQGCEGGYPYLVGKHAADFGIPLESCEPYAGAAHGHLQSCKGECYADPARVLFAADYNYVGGFYGACGAARMMRSLLDDGPVVVAIEVPNVFTLKDADTNRVIGDWDDQTRTPVFNLRNVEGARPKQHSRNDPKESVKWLEAEWDLDPGEGCAAAADAAADAAVARTLELEFPGAFLPHGPRTFALNSDGLSSDASPHQTATQTIAKTLGVAVACVRLTLVDGARNGWEYTNHAITLVGWGERQVQHDHGEVTEKYWIIRNSWGGKFGDAGYAYVARGADYAGIESQAVAVAVDRDRGLMKAWLDAMPASRSSEVRKVAVDAGGHFAAA